MSFTSYLNANRYINEGLIRLEPRTAPTTRVAREWMQEFLKVIGNPEQAFPAIHVAGTSGKGSVALFIAEILKAHGMNVGLHTSPYLQSATEKLWVNGRYASTAEYVELVEWIKPYAERWKGSESPIHGMASVAICLEHFRRKQVDIAVIEAGVGGKNDLTNVLNTTTGVVGSIALDHTKTLGETLEEIAVHKAGIAKPGVPLVVLDGPVVDTVISEATKIGALVQVVKEGRTYERYTDDPQDNRFKYLGENTIEGLYPAMFGAFQATNAALAVAAVENALITLGQSIVPEAVQKGLASAILPGRLEVMKRRPRVILDGAHNPHKLETTLNVICSDRYRGKMIAIIGQLASKNAEAMAKVLKNYCHIAIVTEPSVYAKKTLKAEELAVILEQNGIQAQTARTPTAALQQATVLCDGDDRIVVTGSFYLAGEMREAWYPTEQVVEQRTSFPR